VTETSPNQPPVCASCGGRHWFLTACIDTASTPSSTPGASGLRLNIDPPASQDEIERAVRFYRKHRERQRNAARLRKKARSGSPQTPGTAGH